MSEGGYYSFAELYSAYEEIDSYKTFDLYYGSTWTTGWDRQTNPTASNYGAEWVYPTGGSISYPTTTFAKIRCVVKPGNNAGSTPKAKVILGENNNLNFVYDNNTYIVGDTYTDNLGETTIKRVYDVPLMSSESQLPGWYDENAIRSVYISDSFHDYEPISTAYWFATSTETYYKPYTSIIGLNNINTSKTLNMSNMFRNYYYPGNSSNNYTWTLSGIENWDVSNVMDMSYMFYRTGPSSGSSSTWTLDLSNWNVGKVQNMTSMFEEAGYGRHYVRNWSLNTTGWDTGNVRNMSRMFYYGAYSSSYQLQSFSLAGINDWNVENVTDMSYMFYETAIGIKNWSFDLSGWEVGNVIWSLCSKVLVLARRPGKLVISVAGMLVACLI